MNKYINLNQLKIVKLLIFVAIIFIIILIVTISLPVLACDIKSILIDFICDIFIACLTMILAIFVLMGQEDFTPLYDAFKALYDFKFNVQEFNYINKNCLSSYNTDGVKHYRIKLVDSFLRLKSSMHVFMNANPSNGHNSECTRNSAIGNDLTQIEIAVNVRYVHGLRLQVDDEIKDLQKQINNN